MANKKGCTACSTVLDMFLHTLNTGIIKFSNISMKKICHKSWSGYTKDYFYGRNGQKWDGRLGGLWKFYGGYGDGEYKPE